MATKHSPSKIERAHDAGCTQIDDSTKANQLSLHRFTKVRIDQIFPQYPESGDRVLVEGMVEKRGAWKGSWQPRYFVLEAKGRLCYFMSEFDRACPELAKRSLAINIDACITVGTSPTRELLIIEVKANDATDGRLKLSMGFREPIAFDRWLSALSDTQRRVRYVSSRALC